MQCESVQLFVDRAQAVLADFQVTRANASAVAELCHRLEGIPLAIELAAARAQVMSPVQILAQLEHRFDFLVSRQRDVAMRHRTLRAAIDWSYQLLSPELQRFFAQLSVFRGSWTVEAAEAICDFGLPILDSGADAATIQNPKSKIQNVDVLDYLAQLRECSLILAEESAGEMRFWMLETLREYGQEKLADWSEAEVIGRRHRDYFCALVETARENFQGPDEPRWIERLESEHDNIRAALACCQAAPDGAEVGARMVFALWRFWWVHGYMTEGRKHTAAILAREDLGPTRARRSALRGWGAGERAGRLCRGKHSLSRVFGNTSGVGRPAGHCRDSPCAGERGPYPRRLRGSTRFV
jgi:non-specific serine/threonine protein kinase